MCFIRFIKWVDNLTKQGCKPATFITNNLCTQTIAAAVVSLTNCSLHGATSRKHPLNYTQHALCLFVASFFARLSSPKCNPCACVVKVHARTHDPFWRLSMATFLNPFYNYYLCMHKFLMNKNGQELSCVVDWLFVLNKNLDCHIVKPCVLTELCVIRYGNVKRITI